MLLNAENDCTLESLVCPSCASNNIVYRLTCWRCGGALPYRLDPNGHVRANHLPAPAPWSQSEMDSLMSQAVLFDLTGVAKAPSPKRKPVAARPSLFEAQRRAVISLCRPGGRESKW